MAAAASAPLMLVAAAGLLAATSGLLVAVTPSQPTLSLSSKAQKKEYRELLSRLHECEQLPACDQCAAAQHALIDGAQGAPLSKGGRDVHNRAMALCVAEPRVVEALFEEVAAAGVASESSYAVLMRALVGAGELAEASHLLRRLIDTESFLPRVRTCAPLLHALASSGAQRPALDLWRLLRRRGVEFTPAEHGVLIQMHARAGASRSVARRLDTLLHEFPRLQPPEGEVVFGAIDELSRAAPYDGARVARAPIDAHGVCGCSGVQLRQLGLSDAEREGMEGALLRRANPNPDPNPSPNPDPNPSPNPDPNLDPTPTPDPHQASCCDASASVAPISSSSRRGSTRARPSMFFSTRPTSPTTTRTTRAAASASSRSRRWWPWRAAGARTCW